MDTRFHVRPFANRGHGVKTCDRQASHVRVLWLSLLALGLAGAAAGAVTSRVSVLTGAQVIHILDDTVDWYRTLGTQQQHATQPSDLLILFANRQTADKVIGLAFDIARANAELLSSEASSAADASASQSLTQQEDQLSAQAQSIQEELNAGKQKLATAGRDRPLIEAKLPELAGELAMVNARKNLLETMTQFVSSTDPKAAGANALKAQIDAIAATVPSASAHGAATAPAAAATGAGAGASAGAGAATADANANSASSRYGIWDLATEALRQRSKLTAIKAVDSRTAALTDSFRQISAAPLAELKIFSARSDALAAQADHATSGTLKDLRGEFDTLAWLFKQTSDILIPLSEEQILLQQYRHNLATWQDAVQKQYHDASIMLAIRLGIVVGILFLVFLLGEVWKRAVLRYAHEPRRRYQLLLVRTIMMWTIVVAVVGLSFVTEISTFATFAGLLTAGLAVAMQSVLVSVVGYFFLIGKYGIRVGDRIQIGTVTGEVIDIGLVRMHLMELNSQGPLGPTGRVVAFANLIVFQASGGLFKQIPGVNLSWHETTVALPAVSDYAVLKDKLLAAIRAIGGDYSEEISRQAKEIERTTATDSITDNAPQVQMHLANGHMEALIRYPVNLKHAAEIDERVAEAILAAIAGTHPG